VLVEIVKVVGDTASVKAVAAYLPARSATFTVKLNEPVVVALPEIIPELDKTKPGGKVPLDTDQT
jgi:hypothetical protein